MHKSTTVGIVKFECKYPKATLFYRLSVETYLQNYTYLATYQSFFMNSCTFIQFLNLRIFYLPSWSSILGGMRPDSWSMCGRISKTKGLSTPKQIR